MNQRYTSDTRLFPLFSKIFGTPPPLQMTQFLEGPTSFPPPPPLIRGWGWWFQQHSFKTTVNWLFNVI